MLKRNYQKKNLTTCERKISSYKPPFRATLFILQKSNSNLTTIDDVKPNSLKNTWKNLCFFEKKPLKYKVGCFWNFHFKANRKSIGPSKKQ